MLKDVSRLLERHPIYDEAGGFGGVTMEGFKGTGGI